MRYRLRVARTLALVLVFCIVLYHYNAVLTDHIPSYTSISGALYGGSNNNRTIFHVPTVKPLNREKTQQLWRDWSKVFHDARPRTEPIRLGSNAGQDPVSSEDSGLRQPSRNHVLNPESEIDSLRVSHAAMVARLNSTVLVSDMFDGSGVVMVGGGEYFGPAIIGLHMLRKTGSILPVEIFVADESEYERDLCDIYLPKYGARCLVMTDFLETRRNASESFEVTHYQLKSLAMLFSSFAEILYLDSDSIPLVNPSTGLFATEPYISTGLVIWPDFWVATESPLFYTIAGLPTFPSNLPKSSSEAGQVLINKKTHLKTLLLANYYNIYGPEYYYPLLSQGALGQGDKETFMAAALIMGESYYRVQTGVKSLGRHYGNGHKGSGMIQFNPYDDKRHAASDTQKVRPAFLHANTPKMNAGHLVDEGDLVNVDGLPLRLWGSAEDQVKDFGHDLEKDVWELLVQTGCDLGEVVKEWKGRKRVCERLAAHWDKVFSSSST